MAGGVYRYSIAPSFPWLYCFSGFPISVLDSSFGACALHCFAVRGGTSWGCAATALFL